MRRVQCNVKVGILKNHELPNEYNIIFCINQTSFFGN